MKQKLDQIIINNLLQQEAPISTKKLSLLCDVSINTLRRVLSNINERLEHQGLKIISKQSIGCYLVIENEQLASSFLSHFKYDIKRNSYNINYDYYRAIYIIRKLLVTHKYISVDDICDELYYSQSTILRDVNSAQEYLKRFNLKIKVKRNQGLFIEGDEFKKRLLVLFTHKMYMRLNDQQKLQEKEFADHLLTHEPTHIAVRQQFYQLLGDFPEFEFSYINIPKISNYMILTKTRSEYTENITFPLTQKVAIKRCKAYELAQLSFETLDFFKDFKPSENDLVGLAIIIECYRTISSTNQIKQSEQETLINESIEILSYINNKYDLNNNMMDQDFIFSFTCNLYMIKNQIFYDTPYDQEANYPVQNTSLFSADLCAEFAKYYERKYDKKLSQSHTLSFLYIFDRVLADAMSNKKGVRILIITIYGSTYGHFYANKLYSHFPNGIDDINVMEYQPLDTIDFNLYDLFVTDLNLQELNVKLDIAVINMEFSDRTATYEAVGHFLKESERKNFDLLTKDNIFRTDFKDKDELIAYIAKLHQTDKITSEELALDLKLRDQHINGERKNKIIFLTTYNKNLSGSYVEIFVNKYPILWNIVKTQVIVFYNYERKVAKDIITVNMILRTLLERSPDELQIGIDHPCRMINLIKK